jgi:murein DD-endopeptidase MepM/ murein hydrolase activator NlpD
VTAPVKVMPGETLTSAVQRTGVSPQEAKSVVAMLGQVMDTVHIKAGLAFQAAVARPKDRGGPAQLIGLSLKTSPTSAVSLSRTFDGALRLRQLEEKVSEETTVAHGDMSSGSLYEAAIKAGADSRLVAEAVKLFSKQLDFARDVQPSDEFRLVFDRKVSESGKTVETGDLLYAEIGHGDRSTRFYRFAHEGKVEYLDSIGKQLKALLLKTPLDGAHITSSFGMRLHPLLGYTRLHPGIDFGAPTGTPVYAAGDGVVEEARWAGGYGHWLKLKHAQGWETGYGHLSAYASGIKPGVHVRQGQVVAYVGSTGLSTGPHLHYELIRGGAKIDPHSAKLPQGSILNAKDIAAFKAEKLKINAMIARADPTWRPDLKTQVAEAEPVDEPALRGRVGSGGRHRYAR